MAIGFEAFAARVAGKEAPAGSAAVDVTSERPPVLIEDRGLADKLGAVASKALARSDDILNLPIDPDDPRFAATLRAQTAVIGSALNTQVRVDENRLRRRKVDLLPKIIEMMAAEKKLLEATEPDSGAGEVPP
jgi:hypothetical protein